MVFQLCIRINRLGTSALGLLAVAGAAAIHIPAGAQPVRSTLVLNGTPLSMSEPEQERLLELGRLVRSANRAAQDRALAAAEAVVNSVDARYALALYQLEIGRNRQDDALRIRSLDALIANSATPPGRLPDYLALRGDLAFRQRDYATASASWTRLADLRPNDPQSLMNLAQARFAQNDAAGAIDLVRRAIAARREGPEPVPKGWYRQWLSIAFNGRLVGEGAAAAHALVEAYPTPENWRHALVAYRQLAAPQAAAEIDLLRLMRAAGALIRPAEYQRLAQLLMHAGFVAEARAVLDEGISRRIDGMAQSPTPEISREIDRVLAQASTHPAPRAADASSAEGRFRLAASQALAGRRAEAEAGFRTVAESTAQDPGQRFYLDLARFWLAWLARSG